MAGRFITFEGPEGSGKSTQIDLLAERLRNVGLEVVCTREPGGTATGDTIRNILQHDAAGEPLSPRSELLLFTASRAQLMDRVIAPALKEGAWVLCDRFVDSTLAYQGFARGMERSTLETINAFAIDGRMPDLTILLDLDVETGFARIGERYGKSGESLDRFEREARDFHERVRAGYHEIARREEHRFRILDARQSVEEVSASVWTMVKNAFLQP